MNRLFFILCAAASILPAQISVYPPASGGSLPSGCTGATGTISCDGALQATGSAPGQYIATEGAPASITTPQTNTFSLFYDSTNLGHLSVMDSSRTVTDINALVSTGSGFEISLSNANGLDPTNINSALYINASGSFNLTGAAFYNAAVNTRQYIEDTGSIGSILLGFTTDSRVISGAGSYGVTGADLFGEFDASGSDTANGNCIFNGYNPTNLTGCIFGAVAIGSEVSPNDVDNVVGLWALAADNVSFAPVSGTTARADSLIAEFQGSRTATVVNGVHAQLVPFAGTVNTYNGVHVSYADPLSGSTVGTLNGLTVDSPIGVFSTGPTATNGVLIQEQGSSAGEYAIRQIGSGDLTKLDGDLSVGAEFLLPSQAAAGGTPAVLCINSAGEVVKGSTASCTGT